MNVFVGIFTSDDIMRKRVTLKTCCSNIIFCLNFAHVEAVTLDWDPASRQLVKIT